MSDFEQKLVLTIIEKLGIGLLIVLVGFLVTKAIEKFKGEQALLKEIEVLRDRTTLEHLQRQIEELYSPLLGLIQYLVAVREIKKMKVDDVESDKNTKSVRNYFVEQYFLPITSKIATLMREKIYLLDGDEIPPSFKQFLKYESQYSCLHNLWKDLDVSSKEIIGVGYPKEIEQEVKDTLEALRKRYNYYLKRIENASSDALANNR